MSALMSQGTRIAAPPAAAVASPLQRGLAFLVGLLLPLVTWQQTINETTSDVADRVTPADFAAALCVVVIVAGGRLVVPRLVMVYLAAVVVALGVALSLADPTEGPLPLTSFAALSMAALYYLIGASLACDRASLTSLFAGVAAGILWESVVGVHDYFLSPWFPDHMEGRVRGTFKKSGQLAAYAFSAVAMVMSLGPLFSTRVLLKRLSLAAGLLGMFLVFASSRRSAILSIAAGVVVFLVIGARQSRSRVYRTTLFTAVAGVSFLLIALPLLENSFLGQRFAKSADSAAVGENWTMLEIRESFARWTEWFPFGAGLGRGWIYGATGDHELHDGHLALLVEMGLFGTIAYYALIASPLLYGARRALGGSRTLAHAVVAASLAAGFVFMIHNRLHRDRTFMIFLGTATPAQLAAASEERRRSAIGPAAGRPWAGRSQKFAERSNTSTSEAAAPKRAGRPGDRTPDRQLVRREPNRRHVAVAAPRPSRRTP